MTTETTAWDASEHLGSLEAIRAYLAAAFEAAIEDNDHGIIAAALGDVAKAIGMTQVARNAGLTREALYRSLHDGGDPKLSTLMAVTRSLGARITVAP